MKTYLKIRKFFCYLIELLFMPVLLIFAIFILLIADNIN
jgi:hypothetical protein